VSGWNKLVIEIRMSVLDCVGIMEALERMPSNPRIPSLFLYNRVVELACTTVIAVTNN
jgi:hypothetical protein